jgi:hypothetical protein
MDRQSALEYVGDEDEATMASRLDSMTSNAVTEVAINAEHVLTWRSGQYYSALPGQYVYVNSIQDNFRVTDSASFHELKRTGTKTQIEVTEWD